MMMQPLKFDADILHIRMGITDGFQKKKEKVNDVGMTFSYAK